MRDRQYDWALGPTAAADKQAQEDIQMMDGLNTSLSGFSKAERRADFDPAACLLCHGKGCVDCGNSGWNHRERKRRGR